MQKRSFRKQTHKDFHRRVKSVNPRYARIGARALVKDATPNRPVIMSLMGFVWVALLLQVGGDFQALARSLQQGALAVQHHDLVLGALAGLLAMSAVMLGLHALRYLFMRGAKRSNSGNLLLGGVLAFGLLNMPAQVWQAGLDLLGSDARAQITSVQISARNAVPDIALPAIPVVSSLGP